MTFTFSDIPLSTDILSQSQQDLRENFDYLQSMLNKDHQSNFNSTNATPFEGRHQQVSLIDWFVVTPGFGPVFPVAQNVDTQIYSYAQDLYVQDLNAVTYQISPCLAIIAAAVIQGNSGAIFGNKITSLLTVTRNSAGNYTIAFGTAQTTSNYIPMISLTTAGGQFTAICTNFTVNNFNIQVFNAGGFAADPIAVNVIVYREV